MLKKSSIYLLLIALTFVVACNGRDPEPEQVPTEAAQVEAPTAETVATPTLAPEPTNTDIPPTEEPQIVASILTNMDQLDTAAPRLIGTSLQTGGELDLDQPIELYFDQPMNQAETAAALSVVADDGSEITGEIVWPQPRVMRFQPDVQLAPTAQYELVLAKSAASEAGLQIEAPLTIPVQTVGFYEITHFSPSNNGSSVESDSAITVIFNRPVVPLVINQEQDQFPNPLEITPAAAGSGEWVNTSVYVWRPSEPLIGRQTYTVRVMSDVINEISATGIQLQEDLTWSFEVVPPTINRLSLPGASNYPRDNYQHMRLDQGFQVFFNQPMDQAATQNGITVSSSLGQVPLEFDWNELNTSVVFTPTQLLDLGTQYIVSVSDNAQSIHGGRVRNGLTWRGTTALPPAIVRTTPADGVENTVNFSSRFKIEFASRMDVESLADKVIIDPPAAGDPNGSYNSWEWSLSFWGLAPSTDYTVTILPGMSDPYGNTITEERVIRFRTAPYTPSAYMEMHSPFAIYREGGSTAVWAPYRNLTELNFAVSKIPTPLTFMGYMRGSPKLTHSPSEATADYVVQENVTVSTELNSRAYHRFDLLTPEGNPLPPGFYFVSLDSPDVPIDRSLRRFADSRPIIIANANLTLKTTSSEAMMWLTDLDTAEPLAQVPVALYDNTGLTVVEGITDENGVFYADNLTLDAGWNAQYYALTDHPEIFGFALSQWDEGVNPYDFGINTDYWLEQGEINTYIYTDRPLYRPDQTVYIKGIARINDDLQYSIPAETEVRVTVGSYEGEFFNEIVPVSNFGTFEAEVLLDQEAVLGNYYIDVQTVGGDWLGGGNFNVAEFRKPTFQVTVSPQQENVLAGDTVRAVVSGEFFSGGSVANSDVSWTLVDYDHTFSPGGSLKPYSFSNTERDLGYYYYYGGYSYGDTIANGTGSTNGRGEFVVEIPAEYVTEGGTRRFLLEATLTDLAGNQVSGRDNIYLHPSQLYAGVKPTSRVGRVDNEMGIDLAVVDWSGELQADTELSVEIVKRNWYSVQEEDENGRTIWKTSVEEELITEIDGLVTDANGRVSTSFIPSEGGTYRAYAIVTDAQGNENRTSNYFWVSGSDYVPWRRVSDHSFELIADADDYEPGDTAELLIASPFQGDATALITIERGHITQYDVIRLTENSTIYQLPITGEMAPNIFVSVMVMKGVDQFSSSPDFKVGMIQFNVSRTEQELNIDITPSQTTLGPRDTVTYDIRVTDHSGAPVEAELSLALVDLALLSLIDPNSPNILDFFYSQRWLSVRTALLLTKEMDSFNEELQEEIKGGGGGGGGADFGVIGVRDNFKDTAHWTGQITTDANGMAQIAVELPDNLTTWELDVRAVTADTKVGQATNQIKTTKPLLVSPQTPRFFIVGDQASIGVTVRNTTDNALLTEVSIEAEGVDLQTPAAQEIIIEPQGQAFISWDIVVQDVSRTDFVFAAVSGDYNDASRPTLGTLDGQGIPVYKYEVPETVGTSGQLLEGGVVVESIGLPIFPNNPDYVPTEGEVRVAVAPSLAAAMTDGLDYLTHYQYECTEQVVSRFLPNVLATKALREAGISDPELEANLQAQVDIALQKLYVRQLSNGGWPWWNGTRANQLVSAYVVLGLVEARDAGYDVRSDVIERGVAFLKQFPSGDMSLQESRFRYNRQAFLVYALARAGEQPTNQINELFDNRPSLDLYARAMLGEAMALVNPNDLRLQTIVDDLIGSALVSASGTHWNENQAVHDYWNWNTDTRTTAVVLRFLAKQDTDNPLVANGVRWLMAHRTNGRWRGTQETSFSLMALIDWMVASGELDANYQFEVALNDKIIGSGDANSETLRTVTELRQDITTLFTDDINRLVVGRTAGNGNLYYTAHMNIYLPVADIQPVDSGIIISRQYYSPDDLTTPLDSAAVGDTVLAKLTIVVPHSRHYVIIDDWLPAGLEAINTSLKTNSQTDDANQFEGGGRVYEEQNGDFYSRGWGWWYFNHVQLRDEKVEISAQWLPAGTYEYTYLARASTPGIFNVIPPTAQEFYFPDVYGRGTGMTFEVTAE